MCATNFGPYMEANAAAPVGMMSSGYIPTREMVGRLATRHNANGEPLPTPRSTAAAVARYGSAGSLMTTATDYAKFLMEVMAPKPPDDYRLNDRTRREMLTAHVKAVDSPIKISWALGWQVWDVEQGQVIAHGGDDDGWHSQAAFSPALGRRRWRVARTSTVRLEKVRLIAELSS